MNMLPVLARAFGVDPVAFERQVEAYENSDRLTLIERRHEEAGRGDADKGWLIEQLRNRRAPDPLLREARDTLFTLRLGYFSFFDREKIEKAITCLDAALAPKVQLGQSAGEKGET